MTTKKKTTKKTIPVILCCGQNGRAVLYGRVTRKPVPGKPVTLYGARMVLYWAAECGGLLGLAAKGPKGATRITHVVPETTETVWQESTVCTPEAAKAIESWPAA